MENKIKEFDIEWELLVGKLTRIIGRKPNMNSILFLIGVQEVGKGKAIYSKEEKQDLMHVGVCKLLSLAGFYELESLDQDGWPHWKLIKTLPNFELDEQEKLLKIQAMKYFSDMFDNF